MMFKIERISTMYLFTILLLCSLAKSKEYVIETSFTIWLTQPIEPRVLVTTTNISATECAQKCTFNPNCQCALYNDVTLKCDVLSDVVFFAPGTFEPGNYTISVSRPICQFIRFPSEY